MCAILYEYRTYTYHLLGHHGCGVSRNSRTFGINSVLGNEVVYFIQQVAGSGNQFGLGGGPPFTPLQSERGP